MTQGRRSILLLLLCVAFAPLLYQHSQAYIVHPFGDTRIYADAIANFNHGKSPYALHGELPYIYPPIFVWVGSWLSRLLTPALGWRLYTTVHVASVIATPFILARFYVRSLGYAEAFALFLLAPFAVTENAIMGGNVAHPLYCAALLAAAPGLSANRWRWFYAVVVVAAAVKITFLILLLLPLLAGLSQILPSALTTAVTGGVYLLQMIFSPHLYHQFREMLSGQTFGARNYGLAPFGATANLLWHFHISSLILPGAFEIAFAAAILFALWRLRGQTERQRGFTDERWLALILTGIVLVNPRMFESDVATGLVAAYFLLFSNWRLAATWVLAAISFAGFFIRHGALGFLFLFVSAFIVGVWSLETTPARSRSYPSVVAEANSSL